MQTLTISDGVAEAVIVLSLASYDLLGEDGPMPLFRPCRDLAQAHPFDIAHDLLLPWSGRISGGFRVERRFHELAPAAVFDKGQACAGRLASGIALPQ